jgi:hypothetical protein
MVPVERVVTRTEYIPVERKIVHYPQTSLGAEVQTRIDAGLVTGATTVTRGATVVGGPVIGGSVVGGQVIGGSLVGGYGGALAGSTYATTGPAIVQGSNYRTQTVTTTQGPVVGGVIGGSQLIGGGQVIGGGQLIGGQVIGGSTIGGSLVGGSTYGATRGTYVTGPTYTTTEYTSGPVAVE